MNVVTAAMEVPNKQGHQIHVQKDIINRIHDQNWAYQCFEFSLRILLLQTAVKDLTQQRNDAPSWVLRETLT